MQRRLWIPVLLAVGTVLGLASVAMAQEGGTVEETSWFRWFIWPGGGGTHIEMGVAMALEKPIIFVAPQELEREVSFYQRNNVLRISEMNKAIEVAHKHLSSLEGSIQDYE